MIDMGMRQHHTIDFGDWYRQGSVLLFGIDPLPLKHSTIEEDRPAVYTQNVTGARDLTGCTIEFNFQVLCLGYCAALKQEYQPLVILRH
jgi:hypothetical protein